MLYQTLHLEFRGAGKLKLPRNESSVECSKVDAPSVIKPNDTLHMAGEKTSNHSVEFNRISSRAMKDANVITPAMEQELKRT